MSQPVAVRVVPLLIAGVAGSHAAASEAGAEWGAVTVLVIGVLILALLLLLWQNMQLRKRIERQSLEFESMAGTDPLTGAYNRARMEHAFARESRRADRFHRSLALFSIDLNRFKSVNDSFGHEAGDALLKKVGTVLRISLREHESLYRIGGDEFCVILPEFSDWEELEKFASRLRRLVLEVDRVDGYDIDVGCSVGYAVYPDEGTELPGLLELAERERSRAKAASQAPVRL
jgi:diguanylate cyclase (GGDEF)-like protein